MDQHKNLRDYIERDKKKHLVFDFDKTLFDLNFPWEKWGDGIREQLVALDTTIYGEYLAGCMSLSDLENRYVAGYGCGVKKLIIQHQTNFEMSHLSFKKVAVNQELLEMLVRPHSYTAHVWSSQTRPTIEAVLLHFGLNGIFEKIVTRSEVAFIKPDPEGFSLIYSPTESKAGYLMIGDSNRDLAAATAAGIDSFLVQYFDPE